MGIGALHPLIRIRNFYKSLLKTRLPIWGAESLNDKQIDMPFGMSICLIQE